MELSVWVHSQPPSLSVTSVLRGLSTKLEFNSGALPFNLKKHTE
jgi:hypothetical protein